MIYCGKSEFGQISRSFSLHAVTLGKRPKNLTQIGFPSLRSVKSDRLLDQGGPPGVLVSEVPTQVNVRGLASVALDDYELTPRAEFEIRARVLSRKDYSWGTEADLSPVDLALGWGVMSDQAVLDRIEISQGSRWYYTRYELPAPISDMEIIQNSGNMHMIPAQNRIRKKLKDVRVGDIVRLRGRLVDIDHPSGWHWRTSLSRDDTGGGSCEIVYLEEIEIKAR
jgi:hypothetical protein